MVRNAVTLCTAGIALAASVVLPPRSTMASDVSACRLQIARNVAARVRTVMRGIEHCPTGTEYGHSYYYCRPRVSGFRSITENSPCTAALSGGATVEDLHTTTCRSGFRGCSSSPIDDAGDIEWCTNCNAIGLTEKIRHDLDFPLGVGMSANEYRCVKSLYAAMFKAARAGINAAVTCAVRGGEPPWSCSFDAAPGTAFDKAWQRVSLALSKCRDADDDIGVAGEALFRLCNRPLQSSDDLLACLHDVTTCHSCLATNIALDQNEDCAALSGDRLCSLDHDSQLGRPPKLSFFIANDEASSLTRFGPGLTYAEPTLEESTSSVGTSPNDVHVDVRTSAVFTPNRGDGTVSMLDAASGLALTDAIIVGGSPSAVVTHLDRQILYVANEADDTVTFLDAALGSYLFGTLQASTFATGDGPSALAVDSRNDILYVANAGDDTVTFLDARTGEPKFGTAELSSFPVCQEPRSLQRIDSHSQSLYVGCRGDASVVGIQAQTGVPITGVYSAKTLPGAPASFVVTGGAGFAALAGDDAVVGWRWSTGTQLVLDSAPNPRDLALLSVAMPGYSSSWVALLSISHDADLLQISPALSSWGDFGVSAYQRSLRTVELYGPLLANHENGTYYALTDYGIVVVDAATAAVLTTADLGNTWAGDLAYDHEDDILYAAVRDVGIVMVDGTSGQFLLGTLEASSVTCGCSMPYSLAVDPAVDRLYVRCPDHVAYIDTGTRECLGGSAATTGFAPHNLCAMAPSPSHDTLYLALCGTEGAVLRLDGDEPRFAGATQASSVLNIGSTLPVRGISISADLARLYIGIGQRLEARDPVSGALLAQSPPLQADVARIEKEPAAGLLRIVAASTHSSVAVIYLDADTLAPVTGALATSRVFLGTSSTALATNRSAQTTAFVIPGDGLLYFDPIEPRLVVSEPELASAVLPTDQGPTAIAVMPDLWE
ncbi:MAG TPA: YncE family protein [Candidatus Binatia bacterium]|nr:YncE family protein [Candidatus Binatia bacterium]